VILLTALGLRIGWVLYEPADDATTDSLPDQREYLELGRNLAAGRGLEFVDRRFDQTVWAYRTPGYPVMIALCDGNVRAIRVVQAVVDCSTALAVDLLAGVWLPPGLCLMAAAIVAVNPWLIYFSGLILSETLFTAMLAWGMVLLTRGGMKPAAGVILLALSVLVRPSALVLPPLLAWAAKRKAGLPLAASALVLAALFPWALRNHYRVGAWVWTSTNAGITKYDGFNPAATGASDQSFVLNMPQLRQMDEVGRSRYLQGLADQYIDAHPAQCLKLAMAKIGRMWSPAPLSAQFARPLYAVIGIAYSVPVFVLALAGLLKKRAGWRMLVMPAVYFTVIHAASVASLRYRLPAEPPIAVLAAAGLGRGKNTE
jgi:4-amino-4-deoxy-L-arabinose transferase-like glycosyltransferase